MATSGYTDAYVTAYDTLRFSWWQIDRSIGSNYTKIGWSIQLISAAYGEIQSSSSKTWNATVNGTAYTGTTTIGIGNNTTKTLASNETIIYHDADGTKTFTYSFEQYFGITFKGVAIGTVSGSGSATLDQIHRKATITSAPNFTDEDSPTVGFSNPAGSAVMVKACISWTGGDDIPYRELSWYERENGYYTFNFTAAEKEILQKAVLSGSNSRTVTMYITTFTAAGTLIDYSTKAVTLTIANCEPDLNPTVTDYGSGSTRLTGNPNTMIRGYNALRASFNVTPKKGATITSKKVTCGNLSLDDDGWFDYVYSNVFTFTVTDNRGHTVSKTVTLPMIEYVPVSCNVSYKTDLNSDNTANVVVTLSGNYFSGSFGAENNVLTLQYMYKRNTEAYPSQWTQIQNPSTSGNTYSASFNISTSNYQDTFTIKAYAYDKTGNSQYSAEYVIKITPVFDWSETDFNFNVPVTFNAPTSGPTTLHYGKIGSDHIDQEITLSDAIDKYRTVEILYTANAWDHYIQSLRMQVGWLKGWHTGTAYQNLLPTWTGDYIVFQFPTTSTIKVSSAPDSCHIVGIYGWNY